MVDDPNKQFTESSQSDKESLLREELAKDPAPALIAYVDGEAAGWVRVGPRPTQQRLARTRAFAGNSEEPWDDTDVWAVSCFVVRKEHRRRGLNATMLRAAVDYAREHGARVVEGYPIDPNAGRRRSANELFHGVVSTFRDAGFREVARPRPDLAIVTLDLDS
jgi:Acetyltransferase (GNAT) family.